MNSDIFSIGTKPLAEQLERLIPDRERPVDTVFINLGVIVRNCSANESVKQAIEDDKRKGIETDRPVKVLFDEARREMVDFTQYVCQIFNNNPLAHNPTIITYHADYSKCIPEELYRKPQPGKRVVTMCDEMIRTQFIKGSRKASKVKGVNLVELPVNDMRAPWRWLYTELKSVKNDHLGVMISNHAADYHIGPYCRTFRVLRSYTGDVIWYNRLGEKMFDSTSIPFNAYTHAILGDKEDVKPTVKGTSKNTLNEIAEREEWNLKTQDFIRERLYKLNIRIPMQF